MNGRRQSSNNPDLALLLLRVVIGVVFIAHGWQKLFVFGLAGAAKGFAEMGVPLPAITAPAVGVVEMLAGAAIIVGLLTRLAALGLACDMTAAIVFFHARNGFFVPTGIEFVMSLLAVVLALAIAGAGAYSIDSLIAGRRADAAVQPSYRPRPR